jgi:3-hydroxyisobutyrate dehydrogenase-like beta-hydroxyacid dehydrogenase
MLSDDAAIRDVVLSSNVLQSARAGVVHVVTSTISVAFADELRAAHQAARVGYVSAPVFGRPDVAETAQLSVMAAGEKSAVEKVRPLLEAVGRKVWVLGDDPKQANAAKIAGNMMMAMAIESMAEAAVLVKRNGLEPAKFFDLMLQTLFGGSMVYEANSAKIVNGDFAPGFRMQLALKDVRLAVDASDGARDRLPLLKAVHEQMEEAVAAGLGDRDWSALADYTIRRTAS